MLCYKDMTFCSAKCATETCPRRLTEQVKADAKLWWGSDNAPIAVSDFTFDCDYYKSKEHTMIYYRHFRNAKRSITLAMTIEPDHIKVGWAQCSPKDQFSRSEGRRIAMKRLIEEPTVISLSELKLATAQLLKQQQIFTNSKFEAAIDGCLPQHFNTEMLFNIALLKLADIDYNEL